MWAVREQRSKGGHIDNFGLLYEPLPVFLYLKLPLSKVHALSMAMRLR
jgi:hypothetical protein